MNTFNNRLLNSLISMMDPYGKGLPSTRQEALMNMLWGNGMMLRERLSGVMLPSEEPNWGARWPGGIWFGGAGAQSLRMKRFLQDRLLLAFSDLGGSQQPPVSTDHPNPDEEKGNLDALQRVREVVEDIGMALTGERVLFARDLGNLLLVAAESYEAAAENESIIGSTYMSTQATLLRRIGESIQKDGINGLGWLVVDEVPSP